MRLNIYVLPEIEKNTELHNDNIYLAQPDFLFHKVK